MNAFLLSLGIAIAAALIAAFAAPFFIDWSSQRAFFEERATEILGRQVEFVGPLDVRLVPFPSLTARDVRIGGETGGAREGVEQVVIRAALAPLLSGELAISEVVLTRPRATFVLDEAGRIGWGGAMGEQALLVSPERTSLERFEIRDGTVTVDDPHTGQTHEATGLNFSGSAGTLAGPFRVDGGGMIAGQRHTLRIATGRLQPDRSMRFTASIVPADRPLTMEIDGALRLGGSDGPRYQGRMLIARPDLGQSGLPWRLEGSVVAAAREIVFESLSLAMGPEDGRVSLEGRADVALDGAPRFRAALSARQVDFDRSFGGGPDAPVSPAEAGVRLRDMLRAMAPPIAGVATLDVGSIVLSGHLMESVFAEISASAGRWEITEARAFGPGRSDISFSGALELTDEDTVLDGALDVHAQQATALAGWLFGPEAVVPGLGAVSGSLSASTNLRLGDGGVSFTDIVLDSGRTRLAGEVSYWSAREDETANLVARLDTDHLTLDGLRRTPGTEHLSGFLALTAATDIDLALDARTVSSGGVDLHDVTAVLALSGGDVRIDRLRVGDLQGARLDGFGMIQDLGSSPEGAAEFEITAGSLDAVAEFLDSLGLTHAAESLARRSDALVPAQMVLKLDVGREDDESRAALTAEGTAGGTEIDLTMLFQGRIDQILESEFDLTLETRNTNGARLVEQIALWDGSGGAAAPGSVALRARGRPGMVMPFRLDAAGIGLDGEVSGDIRFAPGGGREISGTFEFAAAQSGRLLDALGIALPGGNEPTLAMRGRVSAIDDVWRFSDLAIDTGGERLRGTVSVDAGGEDPVADATLEIDRIELPWLLSVLLGPDAFDMPGESRQFGDPAWPQGAFTPIDTAGWRGRLNLSAPRIALGNGLTLSRGSLEVQVSPGRFLLQGLEGGLLGGQFAADLDLALMEGVVQLDGRVDVAGLRLEDIVWRTEGRPLAGGSLSLSADLGGSGRSVLAVMSTLTGSGSLRIDDGVVRRLNPRAFDQIVRAADAGMELVEDEVRQVFLSHLDTGSLQFERAEGAFALAGGVARARNVSLDTAQLDSFASATVDLPTMAIDSEWTLRVDARDIDQRSMEVGIVFSGPLDAPSRDIDVNPLLSYLTVRAFEQEVRRLEELQAEIDARAWLSRELLRFGRATQRFRAGQEERARRREEEDEAARLEAEQQAQAAGSPAEAGEPPEPEGAISLERLIRDALQGIPGQSSPGPEPETNRAGGAGQPINIVPPPDSGRDGAPPGRQPGQPLRLDPSLPVR